MPGKKFSEYGNMPTVAEHQKKAFDKYKSRSTSLEAVFDQTLKIISEMQDRIESELFAGLSYKGGDFARTDNRLIQSAAKLGTLVTQLQGLAIRLAREKKKQADNMSLDAKIDHLVTFASKLPKGYQRAMVEKLREVGIV